MHPIFNECPICSGEMLATELVNRHLKDHPPVYQFAAVPLRRRHAGSVGRRCAAGEGEIELLVFFETWMGTDV